MCTPNDLPDVLFFVKMEEKYIMNGQSYDISKKEKFALLVLIFTYTARAILRKVSNISLSSNNCTRTWLLNGSETVGDLVLIQTSLFLLCK